MNSEPMLFKRPLLMLLVIVLAIAAAVAVGDSYQRSLWNGPGDRGNYVERAIKAEFGGGKVPTFDPSQAPQAYEVKWKREGNMPEIKLLQVTMGLKGCIQTVNVTQDDLVLDGYGPRSDELPYAHWAAAELHKRFEADCP